MTWQELRQRMRRAERERPLFDTSLHPTFALLLAAVTDLPAPLRPVTPPTPSETLPDADEEPADE